MTDQKKEHCGCMASEPMVDVYLQLRQCVRRLPAGAILSFDALDPDVSASHFAGELFVHEGKVLRYRSLKTWVELAEQLGCRTLMPTKIEGPLVRFRFQKIDEASSWHTASLPSGDAEKYGVESGFFRIQKMEEPSFLVEYMESLHHLALPSGARVLNAGIHRGDEFAVLSSCLPSDIYDSLSLVGFDHCGSAIAHAREQSTHPHMTFVEGDLNQLSSYDLGQFDLIISIGTLHSPHIESRRVLQELVRNHLTPTGHVLFGFPNCRYVDHEVRYGAKMKNYSRPELSVMWKEVAYYKRYLQQHRFRVTITGKHTVFVTGFRLS